MNQSPVDIAQALLSALERGIHGEALAQHFTADATTTEHPNLIRPGGAKSTLPQMLAGSVAGASLLKEQRYEVHSAIAHGNLAILRVTWTGVIGATVGKFCEGQVLTAHLAQFMETRDGRVASIETYDCYEPFA